MKKKRKLIVLLFLLSIFITNIGSLEASKSKGNEYDTCSVTKISNEIENNGGEEDTNRGW